MRDFFTEKDTYHSYRNNNLLQLPPVREQSILKGIDSMTVRGIKIWNKCDSYAKDCKSLKELKKSSLNQVKSYVTAEFANRWYIQGYNMFVLSMYVYWF